MFRNFLRNWACLIWDTLEINGLNKRCALIQLTTGVLHEDWLHFLFPIIFFLFKASFPIKSVSCNLRFWYKLTVTQIFFVHLHSLYHSSHISWEQYGGQITKFSQPSLNWVVQNDCFIRWFGRINNHTNDGLLKCMYCSPDFEGYDLTFTCWRQKFETQTDLKLQLVFSFWYQRSRYWLCTKSEPILLRISGFSLDWCRFVNFTTLVWLTLNKTNILLFQQVPSLFKHCISKI